MARPPVKAQQLADELAEQVMRGELSPGTWLPAERNLAEQNGVSRSTARQAIQALVNRGLAEHVAGSGAKITAGTLPSEPERLDVRNELTAIHDQLRQITTRLDAIEANTHSD